MPLPKDLTKLSLPLMVALGNWVIEQANSQMRAWLDTSYPPVRISVNVSIVQLRDVEFPGFLKELLQRYRFSSDLLPMELTESIIMSDIARGH